MTTLPKRRSAIKNKRASDPIDQVIFEQGLRVRHLLLDRNLNLLVLILSNATIIKAKISDFPKLSKASEKQLNKWTLISDGVGIEWPDLGEDLSLKGFIKSASMTGTLRTLRGNQENILV
jgi:hypothetical protein